ncbi:hypothetical protein MMC17_007169 [Xylographa soralifera]|nr:hypothetical protein [Xylographa soralifera]
MTLTGTSLMAMSLLYGLTFAESAAKVVHMNIARQQAVADTLSLTAVNVQHNAYAVNISVGNPPQYMAVQIDTGSSDLVLLGKSSCSDPDALCNPTFAASIGVPPEFFDPTKSNTTRDLTSSLGNFSISYGGGNTDSGTWLADTVGFNGMSLMNQTFGLTQSINNPNKANIIPIMGVGFPNSEASNITYPSVVQQMKSQGLIDVQAYSVWLNDPNAQAGSILFGGIDTAKYSGSLASVPMVNDPQSGKLDRFIIPWTLLNFTSADGNTTLFSGAIGALLDSGTTAMTLPADIAIQLANGLGLSPQADGTLLVDCELGTYGDAFTFGFNNDPTAVITVPLSNFIKPVLLADGSTQVDQDGNSICSVQVSEAPFPFAILGDIFMTAGYFVFDLDNAIISMAQANLNTTDSNVIGLASSSGIGATTVSATVTVTAFPSATGTSTPLQILATATVKTVSIQSNTPTLKLGSATAKAGGSATGSATGSSASATKSSAANPGQQPPARGATFIVLSLVTLMTLLGGSCMLLA